MLGRSGWMGRCAMTSASNDRPATAMQNMPEPMRAAANAAAALFPEGLSEVTLESLLERLEQLRGENEALGRELLRCYEQLNLVFEITDQFAAVRDVAQATAALAPRLAGMLNASYAFLLGPAREITPVELSGPQRARAQISPELPDLLAAEIAWVRQEGRTAIAGVSPGLCEALQGGRALVAPLGLIRGDTTVLIIIRSAAQPLFDYSDQLAVDSIISYGGHVVANSRMMRSLHQTAIETVSALANAIDAKDNYTSGHSERVGWLACLIGRAMCLDEAQLQILEWGGLLHDVGKIGVPESILNKNGKLDPQEFEEVKKHPERGCDVLRPVKRFEPVLSAVLHHHENHDGSGYPCGLRGDDIPLAARIIHVADIFDALTSDRPYRAGFSLTRALEIMEKEAGSVMDPAVVRKFIEVFHALRQEDPQEFARRFPHLAEPPADTAATATGPDSETRA